MTSMAEILRNQAANCRQIANGELPPSVARLVADRLEAAANEADRLAAYAAGNIR